MVHMSAMQQLGEKPGNNLKLESWSKRDDPQSTAPDIKAAGPLVSIEVKWPDMDTPTKIHQLFADGKKEDFVFRFAGNESFIEAWNSGCITCLYSCPGGKIVNSSYTIRDYTKQKDRFLKLTNGLQPSGTRVTLVFRKVDE